MGEGVGLFFGENAAVGYDNTVAAATRGIKTIVPVFDGPKLIEDDGSSPRPRLGSTRDGSGSPGGSVAPGTAFDAEPEGETPNPLKNVSKVPSEDLITAET